MEEREGTNNNTTSLNHQAAAAYPMDPPRPDNPNPFSAPPTTSSVGNAAPPFSLTMPTETASSEQKKKRGRPRKYNPDGTLAVTLSPMPISSSVQLTSGLPPRKRGRGRGRSSQWLKKPEMFQFDRSPVETSFAGVGTAADFVGANFTPHMLTVNAGEDVTMKIMTFSQQGSRAICILSANGLISNVTLRQTTTSGGTLTYEGRFEILSLTGLFMQTDSGGTRSRAGGMSVCLAGPDGRVFGGGLAGLFLAAGPVQVMVATFVAAQEQSHLQLAKERRQRFGAQPPPSISFNITAEERKARFERLNNSVTVPAPTPSFPHDNTGNAVHSYYTNSVNHVKDPFSSIQGGGGGGGGGEDEGEEDEGDGDELEGEDEEFGESDNEIPS
ncbi:PREDICTED: AT-hook motif nuclear-localized protein 3-like [Brassica oleracea var. oleracea]|uniref:AT-hook motif nuclear-localized protein n=1 Tax=Brassica oleracea var. oleracea TaxID=109376 RepID=A0A0D3A695_BRAOL|nr:PREDICTED: AT-hook motif nuclear-localized protein 3-like [Brassica oleracea var. oleracea]